MFEDWIMWMGGLVIIAVIIVIAFLKMRSAEQQIHESTHKLRVYTTILNAVTELNLAGGDAYKMDIARKNIALAVNRLNLIGSPGVLRSVNELLDFLNEHQGRDFDTLRLHNILNTLVIEARRDLNPSPARQAGEAQMRYRFFSPPKMP